MIKVDLVPGIGICTFNYTIHIFDIYNVAIFSVHLVKGHIHSGS
jgi:hypothetical protein